MSNKTHRLAIVGAGGHARVIADAVLKANEAGDDSLDFVGWIDQQFAIGTRILGRPVLGRDTDAQKMVEAGDITCFVIGVGSLSAGAELRQKLFAYYQELGLEPATIVHPGTIIGRDVEIGSGTVVMAGAVINVGSRIGSNSIINTSCSIDHDAKIGNHVHIAPGSVLSGDVQVDDFSHVGTGAKIRQGTKIGNNATVGAGAVVILNVSDGNTVVGVPAKPV